MGTPGIIWENQEVVIRHNRYHGPQFMVTHSKTQRGIIYPTLFNVVVYSLVQHCLSLIVKEKSVIHQRLVHAVVQSESP